jgi:hypothetical protein
MFARVCMETASVEIRHLRSQQHLHPGLWLGDRLSDASLFVAIVTHFTTRPVASRL